MSQPERPLRVLHIITDLQTGGAETVLSKLILNLQAQGVHSRVISLRTLGPFGRKLMDANIEVLALGLPSPLNILKWPKMLRWVLWADLIDGWLYHATLVASKLGFIFRRPVIWNVRGALQTYSEEKFLTKMIVYLNAQFSWQPKSIVYNSQLAKTNHESLGFKKNGLVIFNGFAHQPPATQADRDALRVSLSLPMSEKIVLAVGRYHPDKDYPTFLRSVVQLLMQQPNLSVVVVGRGLSWSEPKLADSVPEEFRRRILFVGEKSDVRPFYKGADLFLLTSQTESFPNVLAEAISYGVPAISTNVGAAQEILADSSAVCRVGDFQQIAKRANEILSLTDGARNSLIESNRAFLRSKFQIEKMNEAFLQNYRQWRLQ